MAPYKYIPYPKWIKDVAGKDIIVNTIEEHDTIKAQIENKFIKRAPVKRAKKTKKG